MSNSQAMNMVSAVVDLRLGSVLASTNNEDAKQVLEDIATAAPELFATDQVSWEMVFGRLQSPGRQGFQDLVLLSPQCVYVVLRSARDISIGLVSVAPHTRNIGNVLAQARARLREIEDGS